MGSYWRGRQDVFLALLTFEWFAPCDESLFFMIDLDDDIFFLLVNLFNLAVCCKEILLPWKRFYIIHNCCLVDVQALF